MYSVCVKYKSDKPSSFYDFSANNQRNKDKLYLKDQFDIFKSNEYDSHFFYGNLLQYI